MASGLLKRVLLEYVRDSHVSSRPNALPVKAEAEEDETDGPAREPQVHNTYIRYK